MKKVGIAALAAVVLAFLAAGAAAALTTRNARDTRNRSRSRTGSGSRWPTTGRTAGATGRPGCPPCTWGARTRSCAIQHWSQWTASSAFSRGTLWVDNCIPNCAAGHYTRYPAEVSLSRVAAHGEVSYFSRMRLRYYHTSARDYGFRWGTYRGATIPLWMGGPG